MGEISLEEKPTYSRVEQRKRKRNQAKKRWTLVAVIFVGIVIVTSALWANRGGNHDKADQVVNDNNHQQNEHIGQTDDPDLDWDLAPDSDPDSNVERSEERRVGKECTARQEPEGTKDRSNEAYNA